MPRGVKKDPVSLTDQLNDARKKVDAAKQNLKKAEDEYNSLISKAISKIPAEDIAKFIDGYNKDTKEAKETKSK